MVAIGDGERDESLDVDTDSEESDSGVARPEGPGLPRRSTSVQPTRGRTSVAPGEASGGDAPRVSPRARAELLLSAARNLARGVRGSLERLGVASLLSMLEYESRSGVLAMWHPDGLRGRVVLDRGFVVAAELSGGCRLHGEDAVIAMVPWREGTFEFEPMAVDGAESLRVRATSLVFEAARRAGRVVHSN